MATKLVYTGTLTVAFSSINREVRPDEEFYVPDELVDSFLQRSDIKPAPSPVEAPKPTKKTTESAN